MPNQPETNSYKGWMNSDSFFKRAFATFGYGLVANMIITTAFLIIMAVVAGLIALVTTR